MKLKDIETSVKEALEDLKRVREEIIVELNTKDSLLDEISNLRVAKNKIEVEKRGIEEEKIKNIEVLEKTVAQIDVRREQNAISIDSITEERKALESKENMLKMSIKNKTNFLKEITYLEQEIALLSETKKEKDIEIARVNIEVGRAKKYISDFEEEKNKFNFWKIEQEKYIQEQLAGLSEKENYLGLMERRITKLSQQGQEQQ